ncbi:NAD(P)/FAD-dependent oxidoreductase [uncultured Lutibacter sp.]|uniref:NAD(P)/FAD-dependent oxidoreductase n=1 Tax=uncultured Lutibacter sp. TaxID=437739 RepID=UPI002627BB8A|nr:NAD(P)/FAD-dependent oxidoreductase [uncultured Lutibacter sp.]
MESFDVLIIGGSAAGLSCALILGSAMEKPFAKNKKIGIITHQKASALQNAELNNVLGFKKGTKGSTILEEGLKQLTSDFPKVIQISNEKVVSILKEGNSISIKTNKNLYKASKIVITTSPAKPAIIKGLESYVIPHPTIPAIKDKIMLKNHNHIVAEGIYVAGVIAGWRSQYAIAAGSGALVATDILTEWNNGNHTMIHDVIE